MSDLIPLPRGEVSEQGRQLEEFLKQRVKGQPRALRYLREAMEVYWAGLRNPKKPILVVIFMGPSAVGKTETAKALAEYLFGQPDRLTFISCPSFQNGHEVSKLLGSPPGYVGYGEAPMLSQMNIDKHDIKLNCENGQLLKELLEDIESELKEMELEIKEVNKQKKHLEQLIKDAAKHIKRVEELLDERDKKIEELGEKLNKRGLKAWEEESLEKDLKKEENMRKVLDRMYGDLAEEQVERAADYSEARERERAINKGIQDAKKDIKELTDLRDADPQKMARGVAKIINGGGFRYTQGRFRSLIYFDEIEKGHPDLHRAMLEMMDEGRVSLNNGDVTDVTNSIIIMTSNLGSDDIAEELNAAGRMGFGAAVESREILTGEKIWARDQVIYEMARAKLERFFPPEFVNRINKKIVFRPLDYSAMREIFELRISEKKKTISYDLEFDEESKDLIVRGTMKRWSEGARLLANRIREYIDDELAVWILNNRLEPGDTIVVRYENGKLVFYRRPTLKLENKSPSE